MREKLFSQRHEGTKEWEIFPLPSLCIRASVRDKKVPAIGIGNSDEPYL